MEILQNLGTPRTNAYDHHHGSNQKDLGKPYVCRMAPTVPSYCVVIGPNRALNQLLNLCSREVHAVSSVH